MIIKFKVILFAALFYILLLATSLQAQVCKLTEGVKILDSVSASAAKWANFRNNPGSLRFESDKLLKAGYSLLTSKDGQEKFSGFVFASYPQKSLTDYADYDYCQKKLEASSKDPIKFEGLNYLNIDDLSKWFSDFSQGSGAEGSKLYELCDKSCSPHYDMHIRNEKGVLHVTASVVCGHARDKSDDMYLLCTGIKT